MKKRIVVMVLLIGIVFSPTQKAHAIWWWVAKAAIKKAIIAADLAIQKQQNKVIWLQNAQKTLENTMSKLKLDEISDWTEKQRTLYKNYFEELNKVRTLITYYKRIKEITQNQLTLVQQYKQAWARLRSNKNFTPDELDHMYRVYQGILGETVDNIDQLSMVVNSFATQMSDAKRIEIIAAVSERVEDNLTHLSMFNHQNFMLAIQRSQEQKEIDMLRIWMNNKAH